MPGLCHLPVELITRIADYIAEDEVPSLFNMAVTCTALREVVQSMIFRTWSYAATTQRGGIDLTRLNPFLDALRSNSTLAQHLCTFEIPPPVYTPYEAETYGLGNSSIHDQHQCERIGTLIITKAHNLKSLKIAYPYECTFLDTIHPSLEELFVRPAGTWISRNLKSIDEHGLETRQLRHEGRLDVAFLSNLLRSPMLRALTMEATEIVGLRVLDGNSVNATSLEEIDLWAAKMDTETVRSLIQSSRSLKSFIFRPAALRDSTGWNVVDANPLWLPSMQTILRSLKMHHNSLQVLRLHCPGSSWHPNLYVSPESLHTFSALRCLDIEEPLLLGWRTCPHICLPDGGNSVVPPADIADLLPPSLETLVLRLDVFYSTRYPPRYATDIVAGLIKAKSYLVNLSSLTLSFPHEFCDLCLGYTDDGVDIDNAHPMVPFHGVPTYGVGVTEAMEIWALMEAARFSLHFLGNKRYWMVAIDG